MRLLDASINRCREGLRALEDLARFVLNDSALSGEIKHTRHRLRDAVESLPGLAGDEIGRQAWRDTPGDVGVGIKAAAEGERASLGAVGIAAGKRAGEALRVLEEVAKTFSDDSWRTFEALRYVVYGLEQRVVLALGGREGSGRRSPQWRLCVLVTTTRCRLDWREVVRRSLEGGADCIQLREKESADRQVLTVAREMRSIIGGRAAMIVNDRIDLAILSGANGVHLGQDDLSVADARRLGGSALHVGVSTHDLKEAANALASGADYVGVGSMFASDTKVRDTSGPDFLRSFLAQDVLRSMPHLAIGGIHPGNAGELVAMGCRGVAVSSAVCASEDPASVCRELRRSVDAGWTEPESLDRSHPSSPR